MSKYDFDNETPFSAYITNLGKYNEGELVGEWVSFPTTGEELGEVLDRIGINEEYEEIFITDYDNYTDLPINDLGEYPNLNELNYLADIVEGMDEEKYNTLCAAVEMHEAYDLSDMIDVALNVEEGNFILTDDIKSENDLGREVIEQHENEIVGASEYSSYIDYKEFGETIADDFEEEEISAYEDENGNVDYAALGEDYADGLTIGAVKDFIDNEAVGKAELEYGEALITDQGYVECLGRENIYDGDIPEDARVDLGEDDVDEGVEGWEDDPVG